MEDKMVPPIEKNRPFFTKIPGDVANALGASSNATSSRGRWGHLTGNHRLPYCMSIVYGDCILFRVFRIPYDFLGKSS
jgi:hypothetical protein